MKKTPVVTEYIQQYKGRRNVETFLKEVAFFGSNNYIATGCDSGHLFIWDKKTGQIVNCLKVYLYTFDLELTNVD